MRFPQLLLVAAVWLATTVRPCPAGRADVFDRVRHRTVDNGGVRIHYAELGRGPVVVMIHGFPDFWYGWREQMAALSRRFRVVAMDLRGYNLSDHPAGVDAYAMPLLVSDVAAVVQDTGAARATIVGHDWGGGVAWSFASLRPDLTERLTVLQTPNPRGLLRELRNGSPQRQASAYVDLLINADPRALVTPAFFSSWVTDPAAKRRYDEALARSDPEAMIHYYRANYPRAPYADLALPNVQAPVLLIHALGDPFLLATNHNDVWTFVDAPVTLRTIPGVGHFVQHDAAATVTRMMKDWLATKSP